MAEETGTGEESLVLTDTAPLAVSAETEYLARFVDCAIVVIESGVTTRAELREAAGTLQRLGVGAVGFVLNRVGLAKADTAFRAALEAVEKHLQAQGSQAAQRAERPSSFTSEQPAAREALAKTPTVRSKFEPEVAAAAAAVARFSPPAPTAARAASAPAPPACQASPTIPAPVAEAAKRFSLPFAFAPFAVPSKPAAEPAIAEPVVHVAHEEAAEPQAEAARAPAAPAADAPVAAVVPAPAASPFAEAAQRFSSALPVGPRAAFSPRPVSVPSSNALPVGPDEPSTPAVAAEAPAAETEAPQKQEPIQPAASDVPWWLSETPRKPDPPRPPLLWQPAKISRSRPRSEESAAATAAQNKGPEPQQSWKAATQSWERAPVQESESGAAPAAEDVPATRNSRLSGLRNLLFVLGVKNAHGEEQGKPHTGGESDSGRKTERQNYTRTVLEAREIAERNIGSASPRLVTAPPEFLPPKPVVIEFDRGDARVGESSTRQDRRANSDGIEVLPSKHGQYKKV
jgi:hypothetical protein